ncbi:MAG: hypothetical protein HOP29_10995, partial [Phycisphaerales bacterium]|nr:hypothetical protein [Phycisphaerales bacterium]
DTDQQTQVKGKINRTRMFSQKMTRVIIAPRWYPTQRVVELEIKDKTLPEALVIVAERTGVALSIKPDAIDRLPNGADTRVTVRMAGVPLREGLTRLLRPVALQFRVDGKKVEIEPTDVLRRVGRRATWDELKTVEWLGGLTWAQGEAPPAEMLKRVAFEVEDANPADVLSATLRAADGSDGAAAMDRACRANAWTWYPRDKSVVVLSLREQVRRSLQRAVTLRANQRPLAEVVTQIGQQTGVLIKFAPGVLQGLPVDARERFSMLLVNSPAEQALEVIKGATGLTYSVEVDGVELRGGVNAVLAPEVERREEVAETKDDPIVGRLVIPGAGDAFQYEFFIRESELPADIREMRKQELEKVFEAIREARKEPGKASDQ